MHLQGINHVVTLDLEDLGDLTRDKGRVDSSHEDGAIGTTKGVQTLEKSILSETVGLSVSIVAWCPVGEKRSLGEERSA